MGMHSSRILELKFRLKYSLNLSFSDFNQTDLSELIWMESRLKKELDQEKDSIKKGQSL